MDGDKLYPAKRGVDVKRDCDAMVVEALKGHQPAIDFIRLITQALHIWDDLIDQDKPLTRKMVNACFWDILITLPANSFYQANIAALRPVIANAILNWIAATRLEDEVMEGQQSPEMLHVAYGARSAYSDILIQTAALLYGFDYGQEIAYRVRLYWQGATFDEYKAQLLQQYEEAAPRRYVD